MKGLYERSPPHFFQPPPALYLLEDHVNGFGKVVHVGIRLHVGVVFITRPAKET